jgi:hypothetical protein
LSAQHEAKPVDGGSLKVCIDLEGDNRQMGIARAATLAQGT